MMAPGVFARYKRVMERYAADPQFRASFEADARAALDSLGWCDDLDAAVARDGVRACAWGMFSDERCHDNPFVIEYVRRNQVVTQRLGEHAARERYRDEQVFLFGDTVRNRCRMESAAIRAHPNIRYVPAIFELSDGCRVQCPFCGLAAEPYRTSLAYDDEGRALWRGVLAVSKEVLGPIAATASCYFASEPFDNPAYLLFLQDFRAAFGRYPQTTTAAADRDPDMLRALVALEGQQTIARDNLLRVSVRSLAQFERVTALFSPEELENVELICNNPESLTRYADAGRARRAAERSRNAAYSICCVAGVRVNMVQKTVSFVEPEIPCDAFPTGMRVRATRGFTDADGFRVVLQELLRAYAHGTLPRDVPLFVNRNCTLSRDEGSILAVGDGIRFRMGYNVLLERALTLIAQGGFSYDAIAARLGLFGDVEERVRTKLDAMYRRGYLRLA